MITPAYQIIVDDRDITPVIKPNFKGLSVVDKIGITTDTADFSLFFDGSFARPRAGVVFEVKIGYEEDGLWGVGKYIVEDTTLEGPEDTLTVSGTSLPQSAQAAVKSLRGSTERVWQSFEIDGTTFETIVNEVCGDAKLTTKIDPALANIRMPFTYQIGESDAAFLSRITSLRDGVIKYHDTQVIFEKKDAGRIGKLVINHSNEITKYRFSESERDRVSSVTSKYQDAEAGMVEKYTAGRGDPRIEIVPTYPDRETAVNAAESLLKKLTRNTVRAHITMPTVAGLLAEKIIETRGFPDASVNREYIVEEVRHTYSKSSGLKSSLKAKQRG